MHVDASLDLTAGEPVRVAVIDTAIDESHPDLAGAVESRFDAIGGGPARSLDHGTSIAGAIAARGRLRGVAPNVRILSARAFELRRRASARLDFFDPEGDRLGGARACAGHQHEFRRPAGSRPA